MKIRRAYFKDLSNSILEEIAKRRDSYSEAIGSDERVNLSTFCQFWETLLDPENNSLPSGAAFLLVDDQGALQGWSFGVALVDPTTGDIIASQTNWRTYEKGRGWGSALVKSLETWARSMDAKTLTIHVTSVAGKNPDAKMSLSGFVPAGIVFIKNLKEK